MSSQILNERVLKAAEYLPKNLSPTPEKGALYIFECLDMLGIENSDQGFELLMSEHCKFGYAREVFVDKKGIPIVKFSKIWGILRENAKEEELKTESALSQKNELVAGQMSDSSLLDNYGPNCPRQIEKELKKRSNGCNVIAFEADRKTINKEVSLKFLKEARVHVTPSEWADGDGNCYAVYPVGSFPSVQYDVCPITDEILIDDYCSSLGKSWKGVPVECRQFLAVCVKNGIRFSTTDISDMIDIGKDEKLGFKELKRLFPKITLIFEKLKSENNLPRLKSTVEETKQSLNKSSPFHPQVFYPQQ